MMKKVSILAVLLVICGFLAILTVGCKTKAQPGETAEEVHRRHVRVNNIRKQQLRNDVDKFFMTDKPSKLSDVRIP